MTLFPDLSAHYVDDDRDILKFMDYSYSKYLTMNQSYWAEADIDNKFYSGDQTIYGDLYGSLPTLRRRNFCFNRIRRIVSMISGYQRQHRKSIQIIPIESAAQKTADQFTKLLYSIDQNSGIFDVISQAFLGALISGMNLISTYVDYSRDPISGDIKVDNIPYNSYLIDPYFTKKDLSDCEMIWMRKYVSKKQAKALLPGRDEEISCLKASGGRDGKFYYQPESYSFNQNDLLTYDEFWYLASRNQKNIVDTTTGEAIEWRGSEEDLNQFMASNPELTLVKNEIPSVKLAIVVQNKVFYNGPNPLSIDTYPFVPVWAYYHPEITNYPFRIQGVVRGIRDAQFLYNRRMICALDILESQINSGWKYKENALVNPKDIFLSGQGKGLALKAEAQMQDVEQILPPQIPTGMIQLSELLGNEISQDSGVNEELLGSAQDEKAGILAIVRQGAGLITLQELFDNLDHSQKLLAKKHIDIIQNNYTPGKAARILGETPADEFYNRAFSKYDAVVEEAPLTHSQKQLALQQALYLREIGVPIPTEYLIENMSLPKKDELLKTIKNIEMSQQQQSQKMEQLQLQSMEVDNATKLGFAAAQQAQAQERIGKIRLDSAASIQKIEEGDNKKIEAFLNLMKAAKELEGIDIDQIGKTLNLINQQDNFQREKEKEREFLDKQEEMQQELLKARQSQLMGLNMRLGSGDGNNAAEGEVGGGQINNMESFDQNSGLDLPS